MKTRIIFFILISIIFSSCASKTTVRIKRCYRKATFSEPRSYTFDEEHQHVSYGFIENNLFNDLSSYKLENGLTCQDFSVLNLTIERKLKDLPYLFLPFVDSVHIRYEGRSRH